MNIPDNSDIWKSHDLRQQAELEQLPQCDYCDNVIDDDYNDSNLERR